jgi:hypothetical protein
MELCLNMVRNPISEIRFVISYVSHNGEVELFKSCSVLFSILLLLVNNCVLPVALRDLGDVTLVPIPRAPRVWFCVLKTWKRSCDDFETFVMIFNEYFTLQYLL